MADPKVPVLEKSLFYLFLALLFWAPLPFASARIWSAGLLAAMVAALLLCWLLLYSAGAAKVRPALWRRMYLPLLLLVLLQCWVAVQCLPLPPVLVEWFSPTAFQWHARPGWLTLSLDPAYTRQYLLLGATYTAGFFLTLVLVNSRDRLTQLLWLLVLSGSFQAVYGTLMLLSGLEWGFFVEKYVGRGVATGTFVNRNHLAGYLVMCLAAGTGLLFAQLSSRAESSTRGRERMRRWLRLLLSSRLRLRVLLALMVIALVLTRSRMGNAAFFISLFCAGAVAQYAGQYFSRRLALLLLSLVVVDMAILSRWFGFDRLMDRLASTQAQTEARTANLPQLLEYVRDFWFTGSGGGSFYSVFPRYQGTELKAAYLHAHNDYLQFIGELGLPGALLLAAFVVLALRMALAVLRGRQSRLFHGVAFAVLMTIAWALLHSSVDFNLQIPANALTFVVLLALAWVARVLPAKTAAPRAVAGRAS
ncbi:O-antigen ligase family protein [Pseudohalioglobus lutimaris]|uniref:O-antigen ligase-related domain-containing protein n=1 Tax=Pseudohalioglobus lutimaris TaxID=1737061 RepID=A0A2N5X1I9_9GAMM|nr:O-antigen ligase family protein [Pseudohalioglobus lutimaris]PLW68320.1 hypothetical protein C0039_13065 [Pseudohalioglobus lutimaris]